jgi:hypothetical protein
MKYFDTLPKIFGTDNNNNSVILTNLMARASVVSSLLDNPLLYYTYDLQDGDTPEIVAHKYYGDVYRYWIVLTVNQILDPQWGWPMASDVLSQYLTNKYPSTNIYSEYHHYEKISTQVDNNTGVTTNVVTNVSEEDYNNMVTGTQSYTLPTGVVTVTISKRAVTFFDYEMQLNENKRQIKLLNKSYVNRFEDDLKKLMS